MSSTQSQTLTEHKRQAHAPTLTVMAGIPGCGKSFWAHKEAARSHKTLLPQVVSSDAIRFHEASVKAIHPREVDHDWVRTKFMNEVSRLLDRGYDVYADATNLHEAWLNPLVNIARWHASKLRLVAFTNHEQALSTNRSRSGYERVPDEAIEERFLPRFKDFQQYLHDHFYDFDEIIMIPKRAEVSPPQG